MIIIDIKDEDDIVYARSEARQLAQEEGFSLMEKTRLATAVSELARNIFRYAKEGQVQIESIKDDNGKKGIICRFTDEGPGIANIKQVMEDGFSSGTSLGYGLPGAKRLVDEFSIESDTDKGTRIEIIKWK